MSCLFNSLSSFLSKTALELRMDICNRLEKNPVILDNLTVDKILENKTLNEYVHDMRNVETWGGALEIKLFCDIYHTQVNVYIPSGNIIPFYPQKLPIAIINITWTGNHFTPN